MAIGGYADLALRDEQVHAGIVEAIAQNLDTFNAVSNNTIRLVDERYAGDYDHRIHFGSFAGFATRRDSSSTGDSSAGDRKKIVELDEIGVKLDAKVLVEQQEQFFRKSLARMSGDLDEFSNVFATEFTNAMMEKQIQDALIAGVAAITGQATNVHDVTGESTKTATKGYLNQMLSKFGDHRRRVRCLVMHSESESQLITEQLGDAVTGIGDYTLRNGTMQTLGVPYLVTDSPSLEVTTGTGTAAVTDYYILALVENGIEVTNSEDYTMSFDRIPRTENRTWEMRMEGAHNLRVKGFQWDVANGGRNPTGATVGTSTNWDKVAGSHKHLAGVALKHRAA